MDQQTVRERSRENVKLPITSLPFSEIPGQSKLFLDHLSDPQSLKRFYPNAAVSVDDLGGVASTVLSEYKTDRRELCDALNEINTAAGSSPKAFQNIERLAKEGTVAVVTGQQAGLFTGPLYTIYKAMSAIRLAEELTAAGTEAVPVFWVASEDHDFEEVAEAFFIGSDRRLFGGKYVPRGYRAEVPVGAIEIDPSITEFFDETLERLPHTQFTHEVKEILTRSWAAGTDFGTAFLRTLALLFEKHGLILLDPRNATLKRLSAKVYADAIGTADEMVASLTARSRELTERGYHAQVLIEDDYFPLFWIDDDGRRTAVRRVADGEYRTKGGERKFTSSELADIAANHPERLSPGVMLRPVVQDILLPTVCYFGGGAEIAYFAQNSEVYRVLKRPVTPIIHRQSFTVVEASQRRTLEHLGLELTDLFGEEEKLRIELAEKRVAADTAELFHDIENKLNSEMDRLDQALSHIDVTVAANLVTRRRKIAYHLATLRKKALLAETRNDAAAGRQLDAARDALFPGGGLQERTVNVFSYLNKYGLNFIDWIYDAVDLSDRSHRIINL